MPGAHELAWFVLAGLLLNLTPGPDMLLIVQRASARGVHAGSLAALGVGAGCLVHTGAATLGLSTLLAASATAFEVLKWLGAAYLAWLGLRLLRPRAAAGVPAAPATAGIGGAAQSSPATAGIGGAAQSSPAAGRGDFLQGFLTNALNPKVALFFLAFLPQFVDPASPRRTLGMALLSAIFIVNSTLFNLLVARLAARAARGLADLRWRRRIDRLLGVLFLGLAARLALARTG